MSIIQAWRKDQLRRSAAATRVALGAGSSSRLKDKEISQARAAFLQRPALCSAMDMPVLHKSGRGYWIGSYPFQLRSHRKPWPSTNIRYTVWKIELRSGPVLGPARAMEWLEEQGLCPSSFSTRNEALTAFWAAALSSNISTAPEAPCRRIGPGLYSLAGPWTASRPDGSKFWILSAEDCRSGQASTLWHAARLAYEHQSGLAKRSAPPQRRGH
jgi:hypothetical protein